MGPSRFPRRWALGALACAGVSAACVLPAATVTSGPGDASEGSEAGLDGGSGDAATGSDVAATRDAQSTLDGPSEATTNPVDATAATDGAADATGTGDAEAGGVADSSTPDAGGVFPSVEATAQSIYLPGGSAQPAIAPSGNPMQRHLIFARGSWWVFFLTANSLEYRSSADFALWSSLSQVFAIGTGSTMDGRTFGIDTQPTGASSGATDLVHFGFQSSGVAQRGHTRAILSATGLSAGAPTVVGQLSAYQVDGTVASMGVASPFSIADFGSSAGIDGGAVTSEAVFQATMADDGTTWVSPFAAPVSLEPSSTPIVMRGALALDATTVAVWRSATALTTATWSGSVASLSEAHGTPAGGPGSRTFAGCVRSAAAGRVAHLLSWTGSAFSHQTSADGTTWAQGTAPAALAGAAELFLACSANRAFAFTVDPSSFAIKGSYWDASSGVWSAWTPVVAAPSTSVQRCYLAGFDRVTPNGVGLLWTESADCTAAASTQLAGALIAVQGG